MFARARGTETAVWTHNVSHQLRDLRKEKRDKRIGRDIGAVGLVHRHVLAYWAEHTVVSRRHGPVWALQALSRDAGDRVLVSGQVAVHTQPCCRAGALQRRVAGQTASRAPPGPRDPVTGLVARGAVRVRHPVVEEPGRRAGCAGQISTVGVGPPKVRATGLTGERGHTGAIGAGWAQGSAGCAVGRRDSSHTGLTVGGPTSGRCD